VRTAPRPPGVATPAEPVAASTAAGEGRGPVIVLDNLTVRFGRVEALTQVTGALAGDAIGLLGPNGAGKTTLLRTLLGFHAPTAGSATVLGRDVRGEGAAIRAHIGYMPEDECFVAGMSAVRMVRLMAELSGLAPADALERAHEALNYVGLGEARYRAVGTYSVGMRQLVKLAQAIVHGPRLLLLDEPTNGLDPPARSRMLRLITEIRDSGEVRVLLSSHLLRDVEDACDHVVILKKGRLVAHCDLEAEAQAASALVEVEVVEDPGPLAAGLADRGWEVAHGAGRRLKIVVPPGGDAGEVLALAEGLGLRVKRFAHKRDSLEEIFLRAVTQESGLGGL